jgi:RNA polymerase sigma-70 factor (ECF subfamily)
VFTTSVSLLERLGQAGDGGAWENFVRLYTPLLFCWARRLGLNDHDGADLVQDVLIVLVRKLPEFRYDPGRSFRGWMRTVLLNKWRDRHGRAPAPGSLDRGQEPAVPDGVEVLEEEEYRRFLAGRALRLMQTDFEPATWQACWQTAVCGRPAAEVAAELGLTVNAVYLARSRVLTRLRRELAGLLD